MKKQLCILVSSFLAISIEVNASCTGTGNSSGDGWGFTCGSATSEARAEACRGCNRNGESCGEIVESSCDDGWFYSTAWVNVQCCGGSSY
jgi:hypothetical protein